ncbi:SurA N-terminal domain-containing protein [Nesterenkonia xinjiangensis]|uniref:Peptidyl-prolyl cis-trans isomerase SurA n=1 Tax=Nesterenkonia xinjiangensis TaxID=225327 RepID=A0A7Z0GKZ3_9MICC|nr:SurA N-terminal domain-containing protein [Nesterenkonia xinjiangensis]NYJ77936.1 peptidyl-prolyl cis-trans isomerase SurA [Nesterenkonia xinjiangensis]
MSKKLLTSFALAGVLLGVAGCGDAPEEGADGAETENPADAEQGAEGDGGAEGEAGPEGEMPEPDTSDIPEVVAEVNGEELSGEEFTTLYENQFQQMAMQSQMSGEEVDEDALKEQSLESMIANELLIQDAEDAGFEAGEDDVEELLETTAETGGMESVEDLIQAYEEQGMSEEKLREDAHDQVLIDQRLEDLDVEEPSEEELRDYYDEASAQQAPEGAEGEEAEMPEFEEVRDELEQELTTQKQNEAAQAHVEDLREDADVETHL